MNYFARIFQSNRQTALVVFLFLLMIGPGWFWLATMSPWAGALVLIFLTVGLFAVALLWPNPYAKRVHAIDQFCKSIGAEPVIKNMEQESADGLFHPVTGDHISNLQFATLRGADATVTFAYGDIEYGLADKQFLFLIQTEARGALDGVAQLRPRHSRLIRHFAVPVATESVKVNDEIEFFASPKKLATYVFSPDLLDWYMTLPVRPWIIIKNWKVILVFEGDEYVEHLPKVMDWVNAILTHINRSAGVERLTQPA